MNRKIAVITGARSEYGILKPLLEKIRDADDLELRLIGTGIHLLERYGSTIREINDDGFRIETAIRMYNRYGLDPTYYGKALSKGIKEFTKVLASMRPDITVVFGDRLEHLAATLAATTLTLVIAHIHGGDKTDSGHIDEPVRHSITRFAHIHFPPTDGCADRLIKMGEEPWRIHKVGALGLDSVLDQIPISKETLTAKLGLNFGQPIIVCIFHPIHLENEVAGEQMHEILGALEELAIQTVIIYPNNDAGSQRIISEIEEKKNLPFLRIFTNLPHIQYISLLKHADALIGNSSSGIIEAPSIKLPAINIGSRNIGREHAENVIFVQATKTEIIKAAQTALYDENFREKVRRCQNPWGDGKASDRIVKFLREVTIDKKLLQKRITY